MEGFLRTVYSWRRYRQNRVKDQNFRLFSDKYMNETKVYRTLSQLQKDPPQCDMYIAGSDQLWNAAITEKRFDEAYFLRFGDEKTGRMTYSVGADFSSFEEKENELRELLQDLDAVSMRETRWAPMVEQALGGKTSVHIDLDPTMLLSAEEYEKFSAPQTLEEPYILTYTMPGETQKKAYQTAKQLSAKMGIKVLDVSGQPTAANKTIPDNRICGPDGFLQYVKNAAYVVTNSFHGTVFAVQFGKKFVVIPHATTGNRVTELLDKLGLQDRYGSDAETLVEKMENEIAYGEVFEKMECLRGESLRFLQESIEKYGAKGER